MISRRAMLSLFAAPQRRPPNFVFVLVDDLRFDELGCTGHPFALTPNIDRIAKEGARFSNAFATTPLCSPSRACFLTGQYAHKHGITDNTNRSKQSHELITWPRLLHDAGYTTAYVGKWHMGNDDSPRPGFDHWVSFPGQGANFDPEMNENGRRFQAKGYITDVLSDRAAAFLEQKHTKPFCLYLAHKAVHPNIKQNDDGSVSGFGLRDDEWTPAARHRMLYADKVPPRRPNAFRTPNEKRALMQPNLPELGIETATSDEIIRNRMRMVKAIDEGMATIFDAIGPRLDDTVVIFTSDHGYFYGEHGLNYERRLAYEETIRIPLLIRYPALFRPGTVRPDYALSLDIAPTALSLASVKSAPMQGVPLTRPTRRESFLVEYFSDTVFPRMNKMGYQAVRNKRWKYIHYTEREGVDELYDLVNDPYEMNNVVANAAQVAAMRKELSRLVTQTS